MSVESDTAAAGFPSAPDGPRSRSRRLIVIEIVVVLSVSLGRSAIYSVVSLAESATAPGPLAGQAATLNTSVTPDRPWFDLIYQLLRIGFALAPVALAGYLLVLSGVRPRAVWFGRGHVGRDVVRGAALAAGVGSVGLAFYLVSHALGFSLTVVPDSLSHVWWHYPVLVLAALQNAIVEECIVIGFVLLRLRELGLRDRSAIGLAAVLRGSYHLYQGFGGFVGNLVMGLLFGWLYRRWGRITPLIVTHTLLDVGAFVGYALLVGHVSWIPV
ncbi:type II CAAX endopeptidase family protein [soil metagenome]